MTFCFPPRRTRASVSIWTAKVRRNLVAMFPFASKRCSESEWRARSKHSIASAWLAAIWHARSASVSFPRLYAIDHRESSVHRVLVERLAGRADDVEQFCHGVVHELF